jgi:hypothetical protein
MEVTFTKARGRRYFITIVRERGPALEPRQGPGYHDYLPHDAVHFFVESEAALLGAVFGRIADGRSNMFTSADPAQRRRHARHEARRRPTVAQHADMAQSESLASLCLPLWELRSGHRSQLPAWVARVPQPAFESSLVEGILTRLDEFAGRWHALPTGGAITLRWEPAARTAR